MSRSTWKIIYYITFAALIGAVIGYLSQGPSHVVEGMFMGAVAGAVLVFFTWMFTEV